MPSRASTILGAFEEAQSELVGKAVVLADGKAGTVENVWLDELHGLRISIIGHTAAGFVPTRSDYGAFDLSADRANAVRQILEREGLPSAHIFAVSGKADSQPLFPDDPSLSANRRVTITLMRENPPLPPGLKP